MIILYYFVKVAKSLDEVVSGVGDFLRRNGLEDWEEFFEWNSIVILLTLDKFADLSLSRVLTEGTEDLSDLLRLKK